MKKLIDKHLDNVNWKQVIFEYMATFDTEYSEVNKLEVNNCIRRFTHSNVKINKRKNIVTDKIIQVQ